MPEQEGILILGEHDGVSLSTTTKEIIGVGKKLAGDLDQKLSIGLTGANLDQIGQEAIKYGADHVYLIDNPLLKEYHIEVHLNAIKEMCDRISPNIILLAKTDTGRDLGPRLAFRLGVGLAQDCQWLEIDEKTKKMLCQRPVYGGIAMANVSCTTIPQMASIKPHVYNIPEVFPESNGDIEKLDIDIDNSIIKVEVLERVTEESEGIKLRDAKIVIAGGRGLGGPEPFEALEELANLLGAGIGASRAVVDAGWVPVSWQIGLTGETITPDLYITVAISGASQHMAGCSGSKVIVAINTDSAANIFQEARYGVLGDWQQVVSGFTNAVRELVD